MDKVKVKSDSEILAEVFRNTEIALQSISNIVPAVDNDEIKKELQNQHDHYERICAKTTLLANELGIETKEPSAIKKAMLWSSIKMNTLTDNSQSHIADMMIQGTVMGITSLATSIKEGEMIADERIITLAKELLKLEETFEKNLKKYL